MKRNIIMKGCRIKSNKIDIDFDYISNCTVVHSSIYNYPNKSLIVEFKRPTNIISTLEGPREDIKFIGNHYAPIECWRTGHENGGMDALMERVYKTVGLTETVSSFLFTGADIENMSITYRCCGKMHICALITAGVKSNAIRTSQDEGGFYEQGTINIIILTNRSLSLKAMTGAVITATEAKTAALQDLDIRSSFTPLINQATGTGTDNIIIAEGEGDKIEYSGGHTKMGEMIAKTVYDGVRDAVFKQNGVRDRRDPFQRFMERDINLSDAVSNDLFDHGITKDGFLQELEAILLKPEYRSFMESSFAVSDHYEKGLISDLGSFKSWCKAMGEGISGREIADQVDFIVSDKIPEALRMVLNYLFNGIYKRQSSGIEKSSVTLKDG